MVDSRGGNERGVSAIDADNGHDTSIAVPIDDAARIVGVATSSLRTWDRRFTLGPSAFTEAGYRRFTCADLDRVELMRRFLSEGLLPATAARRAVEHPADDLHAEARRTSKRERLRSGGQGLS
ncbi:hypothetical protein GCM10009821_01400 [Aeromicrobium halocynthiae]|uniref:HTH merR-type domain-containing protein n=1 Tax=Aeromicrobium halocynthiae TaxID=560557 RepID=A0ABP5H9V3_9ACTN